MPRRRWRLVPLGLLVSAALAATPLGATSPPNATPHPKATAPSEWNLPYCPHPTAAENAASGYASPDALEAAVAKAPEYDVCQADPSMLTFDSSKQPVSAPSSAAGFAISVPANVAERMAVTEPRLTGHTPGPG